MLLTISLLIFWCIRKGASKEWQKLETNQQKEQNNHMQQQQYMQEMLPY